MTPAEHHQLADYVRAVGYDMNLSGWTIRVKREPAQPNAGADVMVYRARWIAELRVADRFFSESHAEQRELIVHELLHVHLDRMDTAYNCVEELIGTPAFTVLSSAYRTAEELSIDALTTILAPIMPLPSWDEADAVTDYVDAHP